MANAGIGAASHLCGMLFMSAIETPLTTVPYKGTGPAMTDLLGGQVDIMCDQTTNTTEQIKGGTIKAYAVTTPERLKILPDLPTAIESGLADFNVSVWHGIYTPKGTPAEVNERLVGLAAEGAGRPGRCRTLRRTRHRAVLRRRCNARSPKAKLEAEIAALEGRDRQGRRLRRLIMWTGPGAAMRRGLLLHPRGTVIGESSSHDNSRASTRPMLVAGALFIAVRPVLRRAVLGLELGTAFKMGPGYFPLVLSGMLILLGWLIVVTALRRPGEAIGSLCLARHVLHPARAGILRPDRARPGLRAVDLPHHADRGLGIAQDEAARRAAACRLRVTVFSTLVFSYALGLPFRRFGPWLPFTEERAHGTPLQSRAWLQHRRLARKSALLPDRRDPRHADRRAAGHRRHGHHRHAAAHHLPA